MKFIICLSILFFSVTSYAQTGCIPPQSVGSNYQFKAVGGDSAMRTPLFRSGACWVRTGAVMYDTVLKRYYKYNSVGALWNPIDSVNNGLSESSGVTSLGQLIGASGNPAKFLSDRYIPLNGHVLTVSDSVSTSIGNRRISFNDTLHNLPSGVPYSVLTRRTADTNTATSNYDAITPPNYGIIYSGGSKGSQQSTAPFISSVLVGDNNDPGAAPDVIYGWQYNTRDLNQPTSSYDATAGWQLETNFNIFGIGQSFEFHFPEMSDYNGVGHRITSDYVAKATGLALQQNQINHVQYSDYISNGFWLDFVGGSNNGASISLHSQDTVSHEDGGIAWDDPDGNSFGMTIDDGNMVILFNGSGAPAGSADHFNHNGDIILNANDGGGSSQGNTVIGAYDNVDSLGKCFSCQLSVQDTLKGFMISRVNTHMISNVNNVTEALQFYNRSSHVNMIYEPATGTWSAMNSAGHYIFNPTTGGTVTVVNYAYNIIDPSLPLSALIIALPSGPDLMDNATIEIKLTQTVTAVTFTGGTVQGTLQVGYNKLVYDAGSNVWF